MKALFTKRIVRTTEFQIIDDETRLLRRLTRYVEDQSIKAAPEDSARGRALGFTMAMLQRRFASSIYAVRRSLERMKEKREKILADPEGYPAGADQQTSAGRLRRPARRRATGDRCRTGRLVASFDPTPCAKKSAELGKLIRSGAGS